jgi:hypothetical protein
MGMDLKPNRPSKDAPRNKDGYLIWGRYNIYGWAYLWAKLDDWGVDTSTFSSFNDGKLIPKKVCLAVADAIEKHLEQLNKEDKEWLQPHIIRWRTCGGYRQW